MTKAWFLDTIQSITLKLPLRNTDLSKVVGQVPRTGFYQTIMEYYLLI